jgi:hypothetical protein
MPAQLTQRVSLLLLAVAALVPFRAADAQAPVQIHVGGAAIFIPVPRGFADASNNAELFAMGKAFTPRHRRLLAFFVQEQDLHAARNGKELDLQQVCDVQTATADEHKTFSEAGFAKVKEQVRAQFRDTAQSISGRTTRLEELLKQLDDQARLDVKSVVPVGVVEESPYSITVLFIANSQLHLAGGVADDTNISAITVAAVKGKPVWLITRRTLRHKGDIEIASAAAREWIAAVQAANP